MQSTKTVFMTKTDQTINNLDFAACRGTQRIVSVNYLFGKPLIPSDFLERIVTSNVRDMKNLKSIVFGSFKMSFLVPEKGQQSFSERRQRLKFSGNRQKSPNKFENNSSSPKISEQIKIL